MQTFTFFFFFIAILWLLKESSTQSGADLLSHWTYCAGLVDMWFVYKRHQDLEPHFGVPSRSLTWILPAKGQMFSPAFSSLQQHSKIKIRRIRQHLLISVIMCSTRGYAYCRMNMLAPKATAQLSAQSTGDDCFKPGNFLTRKCLNNRHSSPPLDTTAGSKCTHHDTHITQTISCTPFVMQTGNLQ